MTKKKFWPIRLSKSELFKPVNVHNLTPLVASFMDEWWNPSNKELERQSKWTSVEPPSEEHIAKLLAQAKLGKIRDYLITPIDRS